MLTPASSSPFSTYRSSQLKTPTGDSTRKSNFDDSSGRTTIRGSALDHEPQKFGPNSMQRLTVAMASGSAPVQGEEHMFGPSSWDRRAIGGTENGALARLRGAEHDAMEILGETAKTRVQLMRTLEANNNGRKELERLSSFQELKTYAEEKRMECAMAAARKKQQQTNLEFQHHELHPCVRLMALGIGEPYPKLSGSNSRSSSAPVLGKRRHVDNHGILARRQQYQHPKWGTPPDDCPRALKPPAHEWMDCAAPKAMTAGVAVHRHPAGPHRPLPAFQATRVKYQDDLEKRAEETHKQELAQVNSHIRAVRNMFEITDTINTNFANEKKREMHSHWLSIAEEHIDQTSIDERKLLLDLRAELFRTCAALEEGLILCHSGVSEQALVTKYEQRIQQLKDEGENADKSLKRTEASFFELQQNLQASTRKKEERMELLRQHVEMATEAAKLTTELKFLEENDRARQALQKAALEAEKRAAAKKSKAFEKTSSLRPRKTLLQSSEATIKLWKEDQVLLSREKAALKIQRVERGRTARKRLIVQKRSAVKIQKIHRGNAVRRRKHVKKTSQMEDEQINVKSGSRGVSFDSDPSEKSLTPRSARKMDEAKAKTKKAFLSGLNTGELSNVVEVIEKDIQATVMSPLASPRDGAGERAVNARARTKNALLHGLQSGNLVEAVDMLEQDLVITSERSSQPASSVTTTRGASGGKSKAQETEIEFQAAVSIQKVTKGRAERKKYLEKQNDGVKVQKHHRGNVARANAQQQAEQEQIVIPIQSKSKQYVDSASQFSMPSGPSDRPSSPPSSASENSSQKKSLMTSLSPRNLFGGSPRNKLGAADVAKLAGTDNALKGQEPRASTVSSGTTATTATNASKSSKWRPWQTKK